MLPTKKKKPWYLIVFKLTVVELDFLPPFRPVAVAKAPADLMKRHVEHILLTKRTKSHSKRTVPSKPFPGFVGPQRKIQHDCSRDAIECKRKIRELERKSLQESR